MSRLSKTWRGALQKLIRQEAATVRAIRRHTFSTDEQEVVVNPAELMTINASLKFCKDNPGAFGNLYDPDEVMTILGGWAEHGDEGELSNWFDPDNPKDRAAILAWCEQEGPDFEDQISNLVCSNLPNRGVAFAALKAKNEQDHRT